ncbi:MarR family winged helix-turn-helix transcriptional regulator [Catellatospora sp. NPDC049111]|uniref:MarR family winged helix-turn-helix transcriptional regulator n=1 Tax=Catellatospora sp. NPDC049111 TaxID=3155271 RepID=UPI0033FAD7E6
MAELKHMNDREQRAWYGFLSMQEDIRRHMNRQLLTATGLSLADYAVLSTLAQTSDGSLRVFALRDQLRWEKTRLTHQVSRMAARGLLERRSCADDIRGNHIGLTQQGLTAVREATPLHLRYVRRIFLDVIGGHQLDALAAASAAVVQALHDAMSTDPQPAHLPRAAEFRSARPAA